MSKHTYIGVTAHLVNRDGELMQLLLGIVPIIGAKTATILKEHIYAIIAKWKLDPDIIFRYISDAASVNVCMFKNDYVGLWYFNAVVIDQIVYVLITLNFYSVRFTRSQQQSNRRFVAATRRTRFFKNQQLAQ